MYNPKYTLKLVGGYYAKQGAIVKLRYIPDHKGVGRTLRHRLASCKVAIYELLVVLDSFLHIFAWTQSPI